MDVYREFEWRGLIYGATEGLRDVLTRETVTVYAGFDPTAQSLHVGHLLPILSLSRLQRFGHTPIAVVGGGTGLIGDPSFKAAERALLTIEQVESNVEGIRAQLARFLDFEHAANAARLVNNAEWLTGMTAIDFMRDIGKYFSVNAMLTKESVRRRLEGDEGISYTEFSYPLLQAYDFLVLNERFGCTLQIGGSDQWGNITAGMDLIRRKRGAKAHGLVLPLLMTAAGTKFGKTEAGSVWLDSRLTSPYEFYQFWFNTDDRDAATYLRFFTFLPRERVEEIAAISTREPDRRHAQRELAREVTRLVHGADGLSEAERATERLFNRKIGEMSAQELLVVFDAVPAGEVDFRPEGWTPFELLSSTGAVRSRGEVARLVQAGGLYVNDRRITNERERLSPNQAVDQQLFVVRKGKRDNFVIKIKRLANGRG